MMRSKKRKPKLNTFMLHSKSTYFYKQWLDSLKSCSDNLANDFRWASSHREQNVGDVRMRTHTNRTQPSREKKSYSKIAHYSSSYILPVVCITALLLVLGCMINPTTYSGDKSYALDVDNASGNERVDNFAEGEMEEELEEVSEEVKASEVNITNSVAATDAGENTRAATTSIAINWDLRDPDEQETYGNSGEVLYRYNRFTLSATKIKQYQILVNAASGSSNKLVGYLDADHTMPLGVEISGISNADGVIGSNIPSNQWGYALTAGDVTSVGGLAGLTYKAVPNASDSTIALTGTEETLNSKQFTVAFGANVGNENPSGHYTAYVQVSAVMTPKETISFNGIETMQEMTSDICKAVPVGTEGRLEDIRDGKIYWVAKFKDNNCWMTQNLGLDLSISRPLTPADSDVSSSWTPTENTQIAGSPNYVSSWNPAQGSALTYCVDGRCDNISVTSSNNGHDAQGNYYFWDIAKSGICPRGWSLPAQSQFQDLVDGVTTSQIVLSPFYFIYGGSTWGSLQDAGITGHYWSSTQLDSKSNPYNLAISATYITSLNNGYSQINGFSVRCVAR